MPRNTISDIAMTTNVFVKFLKHDFTLKLSIASMITDAITELTMSTAEIKSIVAGVIFFSTAIR